MIYNVVGENDENGRVIKTIRNVSATTISRPLPYWNAQDAFLVAITYVSPLLQKLEFSLDIREPGGGKKNTINCNVEKISPFDVFDSLRPVCYDNERNRRFRSFRAEKYI